ncbi:MAG: hypothetical protein IJK93_03365 [Muribaculaceae bacterium]|nr:hypothetical protein [Muribaculaceae bacterium]
MKNALTIVMLLAVMVLTGCHSNEQNYREAYEKAVERRQTGIGAETYAKIEAERQRYTHVINGDSVRMVYINADVVDSTDVAKPFNVVVATFTQRINAKSYCDRLREDCGFKGSYILFGGPERKYFVVLDCFDQQEPAAALLHDIDKKVCMKILEPLPWILRKL